MPRPTIQSTDWDFTVKPVMLMTPEGKPSGFRGNMREDTGEILGVTSEDCYGVLQNRDLYNRAKEVLATKGLTGYTEKSLVTGGGAKFFTEFEFRNKQIANAVGDTFGYVLRLQNSFDRTLRASFELGMLRLTCLNGAATLEREFGDTKKHSLQISIDFLEDAIDRAFKAGEGALKVYDRLAAKKITEPQGSLILRNLVGKGILSGKLQEAMDGRWLNPTRNEDKARNVYNLYNAVTEHLTHQVKSERFEYANNTSANVLFALDNAVRKPDNFAKLILPIKSEVEAVVAA